MNNLLVRFILLATFISCGKDKDQDPILVNLIPSNSVFVIDTPDLENFIEQTDTIKIFQNFTSYFTPAIKEQIQILSKLSESKAAIIAINQDERENLNYIFIAKEHPGVLQTDSVQNRSVETLTYEDFIIQKYELEQTTIFTGEKNGVFIAGNSRIQLEQILAKEFIGISVDDNFIKAHSAIDIGKTSVLLNNTAMGDMIENLFNMVFISEINIAEWNVLEIGTTNNAISLNGISTWKEDDTYLLKILYNTGNQINKIANITPANSRGFYSFTYQDIDVINFNLNTHREPGKKIPPDHFLHYTAEAGVISLDNDQKLPVLRATDPELAKELLIPVEETDSFRGISIYKTTDDSDILLYFVPLIPHQELPYYLWIEDFIVFAENTRDLEQLISSYLNNMTLGNQEHYASAMENLAASSSFLIVKNTVVNNSSKSGNLLTVEQENSNYPVIALQFVVEKDYAHVHGAFGISGKNLPAVTGQSATINLDAPLATLAYPVKNHINGQTEIIVQDEKNVLYLYSSSGSLIWKKQLQHQVTGEIQQVDILKNGNLQYAFSTPYELHVIDRKGNPVKPFPLEFKDEITQPLSIFDYDNNRTYRFVLTQGNNILMYDARGREVKGFDFEKVSSEIILPPKHIRINNKDYILVPESSGKLNILSRQGNARIEVKENIDFSASPWFPYNGNFISVTSNGALVTVYENGSVTTEPVGENGNSKLAANNDILVTMTDNTLKINERVVNLDYGLYTPPIIFSSGQKKYISLTDTQAQRVYIFDENANLLPGFPLYGNSEIRPLENGKNTNIFGVKGEENEVILYQF